MCNVNIVNRLSCFCLIFSYLEVIVGGFGHPDPSPLRLRPCNFLVVNTACRVAVSIRRRRRLRATSTRWSTVWRGTRWRGCSIRTSRPTCCWTTGARTRKTACRCFAPSSTSFCQASAHHTPLRTVRMNVVSQCTDTGGPRS